MRDRKVCNFRGAKGKTHTNSAHLAAPPNEKSRRSRNYVTNAHVPSPLFVSLFCVLVKIENRKSKIQKEKKKKKKKVPNEPYCITNTFSLSEETSKEAENECFCVFVCRLSNLIPSFLSPSCPVSPLSPPTYLPAHQTTVPTYANCPSIQFNPSFLPSFLRTSSHTKIKIKNLHSILFFLSVYKWHSHPSFA